jgi:hypothetical protein
MVTDVIVVSSKGKQMEKVIREAEKVADLQELSDKGRLQLCLLTEETMALMRSITGETDGEFWIESRDDLYELHLRVATIMNSVKRDELIAMSSRGKNEAARGLMGKLRDFFERGADEDIAGMSSPLMLQEMYDGGSTSSLDWEWTMSRYENALQNRVDQNDKNAKEAWDELEKSVVARVADDVKVSIRGRKVELTIQKKLT